VPVTRKTNLFPKSPPILKWTGGKRWLIPRLRELLIELDVAPGTQLIDLFTGGLSVPLGLSDFFEDRVIANDLNPYSINLYDRIGSGDFVQYGFAYGNNPEDFKRARIRFNQLIEWGYVDSSEMAQLFYYLSKTCFNGLCRFAQKKGNYNSPFGKYKQINYRVDFRLFKTTVENWQFTTDDFASVPATANSLIYADPPYYGKGVFTGYCQSPFDWNEQVRLAQWLAAQPGIKIASNYPDPKILELYLDLGFSLNRVTSTSNISATTKGRGERQEMLAVKVN
jgi:DNA adenine methylase